MPRPFTHAQATQNAAFLDALRATGNAREAARRLGAHRATFTKRRNNHPVFAAAWDAALAIADAALARRAAPASTAPDAATSEAATPAPPPGAPRSGPDTEPRIVRTATGRRQLRRAVAGHLTHDHRQRFLLALAATANIRLSAAAAGFSHSAFYQLRARDPGFAREMRLALQEGYERIEMALTAGFLPESHADDAWRHNEPAAIPPMTADQALNLLALHQKEARLRSDPPHTRRRRGESTEAWSFRLAALYEQDRARAREAGLIAEAARRERGEPVMEDYLTRNLPDLAQVTGWSTAGKGRGVPRARVAVAEKPRGGVVGEKASDPPVVVGRGQGPIDADWGTEPPEEGWDRDDWQAYVTPRR